MSVINNKRGSVLIATLIVALITGVLVGVFLETVTGELKSSHKARMGFQAVNLAEAGLEYAMNAIITNDWNQWTEGGSGYYRDSFPNVQYSYNGETRRVRVYCEPDRAPFPSVIAEGVITLRNGVKVSRQIYVELTKGTSQDPTKGGFFANGITAKQSITFAGNGQRMDSFDSMTNPAGFTKIGDIYDDQTGTTLLGHLLARGFCSVASNSVTVDDISIGNADIFGSVASGASASSGDISTMVGPNGSVYNHNTANGDSTFNGKVDTAYLAYDFYAELPTPQAPSLSSPETSYSGGTIGQTGTSTEYHLSTIDLSGQSSLTIKGDVTLIIDGDFKIGGKAVVSLEEGASVEMYVGGDMQISGNGLINEGYPKDLVVYNTGTETDITVAGNGVFSGAIYAPNSFVHLAGGGSSGVMYGAIVGDSVKLNGHFEFHYDEDLANFSDDDGVTNDEQFIPEVALWAELTELSERKDMTSILSSGF